MPAKEIPEASLALCLGQRQPSGSSSCLDQRRECSDQRGFCQPETTCHVEIKWGAVKEISKRKTLFLVLILTTCNESKTLLSPCARKMWYRNGSRIDRDNVRAGFPKSFIVCIGALKNSQVLKLILHCEHLFVSMFWSVKPQPAS